MKLAMKVHYALLLVLYLSLNGQKKTYDAAKALGLSLTFMEQIARKLRIAGVIKSIRGPGGGYAVIGTPTVAQVLQAVQFESMLSDEETTSYRNGGPSHMAFAYLVGLMLESLRPQMDMPVAKLASMFFVPTGDAAPATDQQGAA